MTLRAAVADYFGECLCGPEWTGRGRHDPSCDAGTRDAILGLIAAHSCYDPETLAAALRRAEIGCLGYAGFHDGQDPDEFHDRQAAAIIAALEAGKAGGE